ncbi:MAG TPA: hypothetical protein VGQ41_14290 [Pyrinomonadaceae bacterium]|nr:hypothetical protein [Pyrinomonadaceae bacterium]
MPRKQETMQRPMHTLRMRRREPVAAMPGLPLRCWEVGEQLVREGLVAQ